ncbi:mitochondrial import receptor subunit TOM7 homolog isoform X1 [Ursus maritimus]|uniref:Mitochondrial import receptor subunit TOM7 homolog n=1 Tax=Ursus maritimus TaxID=29073 RepID=A0A384BR28_URSMA|nr:mitochondrial import receptor subunit TOM7 homolog isoform X1 [Ursus maritimus]
MVKLSKEAKQRLQQLFKGGQFAIRWGFIPLVIYLGFKRGADPGMPEPTVLRGVCNLGKNRLSAWQGLFSSRISYTMLLVLWRLTGEAFLGCLYCSLKGRE